MGHCAVAPLLQPSLYGGMEQWSMPPAVWPATPPSALRERRVCVLAVMAGDPSAETGHSTGDPQADSPKRAFTGGR